MEKFKLLVAVMLSAICVVTITPITYAHNNEGEVLGEVENYADDTSVNPRYFCTYCSEYVPTGCYGEKLMYDKSTHNPLFSDTCTIFYYWSTSARKCRVCRRELEFFGYHDCEWRHVGCNMGVIDVCYCEEDIW